MAGSVKMGAEGISRAGILAALGMREGDVVDPAAKVEWDTVVRVVEHLSSVVDGDRAIARPRPAHDSRALVCPAPARGRRHHLRANARRRRQGRERASVSRSPSGS